MEIEFLALDRDLICGGVKPVNRIQSLCFYEEFENNKGVIRIRISTKNRQQNGQKDKQRSTKHTHKTKDRVIQTPLKTGGEFRCSGMESSSCSTSGTCRVNLVINPVISHEWGKNREVLTTSGTYPWSFVTPIFHNGQPSHGGDCKTFEFILTNIWITVKPVYKGPSRE
jgi:hypothetical protein